MHCQERFRDHFGMVLPREEDWSDPAYLHWRAYTETLDDLAGRIRRFIKERNPEVALILRQNPDVIMHEVNNAVDRPQPIWVHWAGEVGRESRTAHPEKPVTINAVMFLDLPYRFSAEQPGLVGLHLAQTIAQSKTPGPTSSARPKTSRTARTLASSARCCDSIAITRTTTPACTRRQKSPSSARSAARSATAGRKASRGSRTSGGECSAPLVEGHVPFDILPDEQLLAAARDGRLARYDALVLPNLATLDDAQATVLDQFVENGGGLVATYDTAAFDGEGKARAELGLRSLGGKRIVTHREGPGAMRSGYLRVTRPRRICPAPLRPTSSRWTARFFTSSHVGGGAFVCPDPPSSRYGPPEKTYWDVETEHPGLLWQHHGLGRTAYFPWPIGALFFDLSLPEYRALLVNAVEQVSRSGRQVVTSAPPQVEVVVGEQTSPRRIWST